MTALMHLYPGQITELNTAFNLFCAQWGADDAGHRFGRAVAQAVLALRREDGADPDPDRTVAEHRDSTAPGHHREDPLNAGQGVLGPRYGFVKPFAITAFHPLAPFPAVGPGLYLADLIEVAANGAAAGASTRSPDQTVQALFWAYDGAEKIGTPPRLYNQILRTVAKTKLLNTEQMARLFMLANVAMGDAGVLAWFYKYHYDLWRPVVGIREHGSGMGPAALAGSPGLSANCNPFWKPLGAPRTNTTAPGTVASFTPPFPAYPSGHATFGAAAFQVARLMLVSLGKATIAADGKDDIAFDLVSDEMDGSSQDPDRTLRTRHLRHFSGLHEAMYENSVSRMFLGVHWRFDGTTGHDAVAMLANAASDNIGGVPLGLAVANDLLAQTNVRPSGPGVQAPPFDATV